MNLVMTAILTAGLSVLVSSADDFALSSDGCYNCEIEDGWTCEGSSCTPVCGDCLKLGDEQCDDCNVINNDVSFESACMLSHFRAHASRLRLSAGLQLHLSD